MSSVEMTPVLRRALDTTIADLAEEFHGIFPARQWRGLSLEEVRPIRDLIESKVRDLIDTKLDAIRTDPTAHRARLVRLLPQLAREFTGERTEAEIRACADAVLGRYDDVKVRSHVMTLAHRQTRECLRAEHCYELDPISPNS